MMKKLLIVITSLVLGFGSAQLALAKKPEDAGGKAAMKEHKSGMKEMRKAGRDGWSESGEKKTKDKAKKERPRDDDLDMDEEGERSSGLAKQREKKAEQERKELGKGSEQGQASREEHSRKWWNFWE